MREEEHFPSFDKFKKSEAGSFCWPNPLGQDSSSEHAREAGAQEYPKNACHCVCGEIS